MKITEDTDASGENGWFIEDDKGRRIAGLFYTKVAAERWIKWVKGRGANTKPWSALAKDGWPQPN